MPYVSDSDGDDGLPAQSGRRDEPRGIARYFQPVPRNSQPQISLHGPAPSHSGAPHVTRTPSSGYANQIGDSTAPLTPTSVRRPSTIAVVINSASRPGVLQSSSRKDSEDSVEALKITSDINPPRRAAPAPSLPLTTTHTTTMDQPAKTPRPRGRPPKARTPDVRPPSTVPHASPTAITVTPPKAPATQPPKRRGRPVGWRPGMGGYSTQPSFPGGPSVPRTTTTKEPRTGQPKRRGRPPGRPPGRPGLKPTRAIFENLRPQYVPFLCEWAGCPAELQNVDTLRRHLLVVHAREGVARGCRWGKCGAQQQQQVSPPPPATPQFNSAAAFERHVEDSHLTPFVWHVGDGPRNSILEYKVKTPDEAADDLPGYLFDENGNQVTPSVLQQGLENEEERKERRRRLRWIISERDRNAPEEVEMEVEANGNGPQLEMESDGVERLS